MTNFEKNQNVDSVDKVKTAVRAAKLFAIAGVVGFIWGKSEGSNETLFLLRSKV